MNIQSISIVAPTKGCINKCKFCVSRMHENNYDINFDEIAYRKRIKYASMNGVNTLILTGTGEALQNLPFLRNLVKVLYKEDHPFPNVELQTSGVMLMDYKEVVDELAGTQRKHYYNMQLLHDLGVNTISLSVSDIFDSENNWNIIGAPKKYRTPLTDLCGFIKKMGFNLRLSLNMTNVYDKQSPEDILGRCKGLGADQITFRKLYHDNDDSAQTEWVKSNACNDYTFQRLENYIAGEEQMALGVILTDNNGRPIRLNAHGIPLYRLPFGPMAYSIMGMSVVVDDNCMNKESYDQLKYVILRENGKLYSQWDDEGSLIF